LHTSQSVEVPAPPARVFEHVVRLERYPAWLQLVHAVDVVADDPHPAWEVELRARVGPFARSKRLRMERTVLDEHHLVVFERAEVDGRQHARWALRAELESVPAGTLLTMHLAYEGALWTGGLLEKALDEEIRRARVGLIALLADE
jgi:uncharacterized protein YndB with AHSA1/START domain